MGGAGAKISRCECQGVISHPASGEDGVLPARSRTLHVVTRVITDSRDEHTNRIFNAAKTQSRDGGVKCPSDKQAVTK